MGELFHFYNACQICGNDEIQLVDDVEHKMSKAGGIRATCVECGRNTKPQVWNDFNSEKQPDEPIAV
jgi:hypothetical protein